MSLAHDPENQKPLLLSDFTSNSTQDCEKNKHAMNPRAIEIMREALEKISSIHQPTSDPVGKYDPEELLEKLDFAVITAREALDRAVMPGECQN